LCTGQIPKYCGCTFPSAPEGAAPNENGQSAMTWTAVWTGEATEISRRAGVQGCDAVFATRPCRNPRARGRRADDIGPVHPSRGIRSRGGDGVFLFSRTFATGLPAHSQRRQSRDPVLLRVLLLLLRRRRSMEPRCVARKAATRRQRPSVAGL